MKHFFAASFRKFLAGGILFGFLSGCSVIDPAEQIPSYLHIDAMNLAAFGGSNGEGSSSSKITDAWIYMDGNLLGAFQLPCTVPILADGMHSFIIKGGIKMNGLVSTRAIYPFWKGWEGDISLTRASVTRVGTLTVNYFSGTDFVWKEDFDGSGLSLVTDPRYSNDTISQTTNGAFENKSGYILLKPSSSLFTGESSSPYLLPPQSDVYLEFDYKCNNAFTVGIYNSNTSQFDNWLTIDPSSTWNKIYVRLTDILANNNQSGAIPFKIYFSMARDITVSQPYLYLDNIKLLK